jgi:hypothetical protein
MISPVIMFLVYTWSKDVESKYNTANVWMSTIILITLIKRVTWIIGGKAGLREWGSRIFKWRVSIGFYLFALLCPIIAISSAYGFYLLVGGKPADFSSVPPWYLYPISFLFVFFIGGSWLMLLPGRSFSHGYTLIQAGVYFWL